MWIPHAAPPHGWTCGNPGVDSTKKVENFLHALVALWRRPLRTGNQRAPQLMELFLHALVALWRRPLRTGNQRAPQLMELFLHALVALWRRPLRTGSQRAPQLMELFLHALVALWHRPLRTGSQRAPRLQEKKAKKRAASLSGRSARFRPVWPLPFPYVRTFLMMSSTVSSRWVSSSMRSTMVRME